MAADPAHVVWITRQRVQPGRFPAHSMSRNALPRSNRQPRLSIRLPRLFTRGLRRHLRREWATPCRTRRPSSRWERWPQRRWRTSKKWPSVRFIYSSFVSICCEDETREATSVSCHPRIYKMKHDVEKEMFLSTFTTKCGCFWSLSIIKAYEDRKASVALKIGRIMFFRTFKILAFNLAFFTCIWNSSLQIKCCAFQISWFFTQRCYLTKKNELVRELD